MEHVLRRSEETARRLAMESEVVAEIGRIISSNVNIDDVYELFAQEAKKIIRFDRIAVNTFNLEEKTYSIPFVSGIEVPGYRKGDTYPLRDELLEAAKKVRPGGLFQVSAGNEAKGEEELKKRYPSFLPHYRAGLRSIMAIPLVSKNQLVGSLNFQSLAFEAYSKNDLRVGEKIANQIAGAVAHAKQYQKEQRMKKELHKSEERYRLLVDLSPLMIITHQQGKFLYLNSAAIKALGASSSMELVGKSIYEVVHPDYWGAVQERINQIEQGKEVPPIEEKYIRLDKKVIDVEVNHAQILDQDERIILVMARDITEQKKAEKEKELLQEQLQQAQKMEAIGTLAGGIAHDFNNILAGIMGYAELASLDVPEGSKAQQNLQNSIKAAHRAKNLVQQILAFSRQGKQERRPLDIRPIVKESLKFLRASLPATIEIRQELEKDSGVIEADPTQIHQVLMNLCANAAQAMEKEGGVLELSLENVDIKGGISTSLAGIEPGPYLRLRVSDTGRGIPPEILPKIYNPYFTTKEVGKGTGLGLAVVNGIVKSYGGGISVSSEVGKGTTFEVYFPRIKAPISTVEAVKGEALPLGGNERVLFVDDEQGIVEIGQKALEYLGYKVVVRTSSLEALELFRAKKDEFDLVITDMTMPNMRGDKLAQELLKIRPEIPVILCTGFSEQITEEKAKEMGIREFVLKPLVMKDLAKTIRRALDSEKKEIGNG